MTDDLAQTILDLLKQHDHDQALNLASRSLRDEPDDERANYLAAECFLATHRPGLALPYALRAIALAPEQPATWNHAGRCYDQLLRWEEAEQAFQRAMLLDPKTVTYVANMSTIRVNAGRHAEALEWCERTLAMESDNRQAICNRGMARLALGDRAGWDDWEHGVSFQPGRTERFYGDAGRWQGKDGETVVFYSEQGLGDEIALAAYLAPCLARTTGYVDVEPRLVNLFKRSFPQAAGIHGTRLQMAEWLGDQEVDRRCIKVGLAWTGGIQETRAAMRSLEVGMLKPILATQGAHFVSLEYRDRHDAEARAAGIHVWPWGTRTNDYDDTAALVAELDLVVAVPTTVTHLAGALGVPCLVLVQDAPAWPFGVEGDRMGYPRGREVVEAAGGDTRCSLT